MDQRNGHAVAELDGFGESTVAESHAPRAGSVASPLRPAHEILEAAAFDGWGEAEEPENEFSLLRDEEAYQYENDELESEPEFLGEDRSSRTYIRWVQASLNRVLGIALTVDGIDGQRTREAVRRFQAQRGLTTDGVVGPRTEQALLAAGAVAPPHSATGPGAGANTAGRAVAPSSASSPGATDVRVTPAGPLVVKGAFERGVKVSGTQRFRPEGHPNDIVLGATAAAEGGYDTVNMYDRGIISWGIMQWTAHQGSLQSALSFLKRRLSEMGQPQLWASLFPDLDVVVVRGDPQFRFASATVIGIPALRRLFRGHEDRGRFDERVVGRWAAVFARAGRHPVAQQLQREYARARVDAVMRRAIPREVGTGYRVVGDYVNGSLKAKSLMFGAWTNNPMASYRHLVRTVDAVAGQWGGKDPGRWPAGWQTAFADRFEQTLRSSSFGYWGDAKARAANRTSRTQKTLDALRGLTGTPQLEAEAGSGLESTDFEVEPQWEQLAAASGRDVVTTGTVPAGEPDPMGWFETTDEYEGAGAWPITRAPAALAASEEEGVEEPLTEDENLSGEDSLLEESLAEQWEQRGTWSTESETASFEDENLNAVDDDSLFEEESGDGLSSTTFEDERSGGSREYILWVQSALNRVANSGLTVDGASGPRTQAAIRAFQQSRGLTADGVVGPRTEQALLAAGAPPVPSVAGSISSSTPSTGSSGARPSSSSCRGATPRSAGAVVIGGREYGPAGLVVANWADRSVRPFTHPTRAQCRRPAAITSFVLHETQGSIPWGPFRRDYLNDQRRLSVQLYADVDGRILQHNDLVELLWHGSQYNQVSIGVEIVAPVLPSIRGTVLRQAAKLTFPLSRQLGLEPYRTITTGWMQRRTDNPTRSYVLPPIDQLEGVTRLIALLTDPSAGHGLAIPRRWVGDRGDGTFVVRGGAAFARPQPGIIGHAQFVETKDDGAFAALYTWLRIAARSGQGLDPKTSYETAVRLLTGAGRTVDVSAYR